MESKVHLNWRICGFPAKLLIGLSTTVAELNGNLVPFQPDTCVKAAAETSRLDVVQEVQSFLQVVIGQQF